MLICRIFELAIVLDTLKLRNVMQLVGLLGMRKHHAFSMVLANDKLSYHLRNLTAFHASLIVFVALQVHEARTALVFLSGSDCPKYIMSNVFPSLTWSLKLRRVVIPQDRCGERWNRFSSLFLVSYLRHGWSWYSLLESSIVNLGMALSHSSHYLFNILVLGYVSCLTYSSRLCSFS